MTPSEFQSALEETIFALRFGDEEMIDRHGHIFGELEYSDLFRIEAEPTEETAYLTYLALINERCGF